MERSGQRETILVFPLFNTLNARWGNGSICSPRTVSFTEIEINGNANKKSLKVH